MNLVTPCHGAPIWPDIEYDGPDFMQYPYVGTFGCTATDCFNNWHLDGTPFNANTYPEPIVKDADFYRRLLREEQAAHAATKAMLRRAEKEMMK